MDNDQKFWLTLWSMLFIVIVSVVVVVTNYYIDRNTKVVKLIQQGADPSTVLCAFEDTRTIVPVCVIASLKSGE